MCKALDSLCMSTKSVSAQQDFERIHQGVIITCIISGN